MCVFVYLCSHAHPLTEGRNKDKRKDEKKRESKGRRKERSEWWRKKWRMEEWKKWENEGRRQKVAGIERKKGGLFKIESETYTRRHRSQLHHPPGKRLTSHEAPGWLELMGLGDWEVILSCIANPQLQLLALQGNVCRNYYLAFNLVSCPSYFVKHGTRYITTSPYLISPCFVSHAHIC